MSELGLAHPEVKRFGKYGVVGAGSLVVSLVSFNILYFKLTGRDLILSTALAYFLSVVNGFIWNRRWTFKEKRGESGWVQWTKFLIVNVIGYVLNTIVLVTLLSLYARFVEGSAHVTIWQIAVSVLDKVAGPRFSFLVVNACGLLTTVIITIWNFLTNRAWTFKH